MLLPAKDIKLWHWNLELLVERTISFQENFLIVRVWDPLLVHILIKLTKRSGWTIKRRNL